MQRDTDHLSRLPGVTVSDSEDDDALDRHLKHLEAQRDALMDKKSHCVSLEFKAELDRKLQDAEQHRDELSTENHQLNVLYDIYIVLVPVTLKFINKLNVFPNVFQAINHLIYLQERAPEVRV